ncbi:MmpS family transport accessory protein [Mycobacterium tuberculosis]|uniref:MmpS family transport accessory protein n=1 Tax=Mycobacterium tuberculosis TaxID=1773 RepID=UPI000A7CCDA1|nr:MmpS family transport accessory protein [Mycobacterium tuberculosis]MCN4343396.1 hypothetical protein [Mycobacterium tuberculosis]MCT9148652.1 MmpS family protein [Mycobacterium tuberculosis]REL69215.1 hypothetical protein DSI20_10970 [Mycobacterium tuberculosis]REM60665.1 hypothetical protein DSI51_12620 [Mycobacterium tuberculosis]RES44065.1 hypothetical protein DSJ82_15565 [Mycobacterium tuberculosis]
MSGPNPPGREPDEPESEPVSDTGDERASGNHLPPVAGGGDKLPSDQTGETDAYSRAYSAPESEHVTGGPYVPADLRLYDYDDYEESSDLDDELAAPRWPWVVGVAAIIAAVALVVSVSLLVTRPHTSKLATGDTTSSAPPVQDEITTTKPAPPPPPTTTTPTGPRQVTYSVTGTKAPGDIISVTYVDAAGRRRTQHNVYIPWSMTVTPISQSDVGSVEASSLFRVSKLNCSITTSDGTVLSSNSNDGPQTSC